MKKFQIEAREFVPKVDFDPEANKLEISGESYHEYTHEFFAPIFDWVSDYTKKPRPYTELQFKMTYFNTASSKCFFEIIETLHKYHQNQGGELAVKWLYEEGDLDMRETGEEYAEEAGLSVQLIPYPKGK